MKLVYRRIAGAVATTVGLAACVQPPALPTIPVAPGPNKSFEAFAADQGACQQYASAQTAPAVAAANNQAFGGALLTTALGAGIGGAVGGGRGAGIGAASGAALGSLGGASASSFAQLGIQQQYDIMYGQCMAAHGNSVPSLSPPPGTPPYAGGPSGYSGGPSPYSGGPSGYSGGPPPYSGGPPPYSGGPPPYSGGPSPYSGGPSPYYGGPPPPAPGGAPYPSAPPSY